MGAETPLRTDESENERITAKELLANPDTTPYSSIKRVALAIGSLLLDTTVPLVIFFILKHFMDPMWAMFISGFPALLICIVKAVWKRQVSVMALFIFVGFIVSATVSFITKNPRILLLQGSVMMGAIGAVHLVSLIPFNIYTFDFKNKVFNHHGRMRPLLYYSVNQTFPLGDMNPLYTNGKTINKYTWLWNEIPIVRAHMYVLTAATGVLLVGEFIIKLILIFSSMSLDKVVIYSNVTFYIMLATLLFFDGVYIFLAKRNFYKHVDIWIAANYRHIKQNQIDIKVKEEEEEEEEEQQSGQPTYLLFSSETNSYDSFL